MTRPASHDDGISLVEVIIYAALSALVLAMLASLLANMWITQGRATSTATATTRGQQIAEGIEIAMRNSTAFAVSSDGSILRVRTNLGGSRTCQGWYVKLDDGTMYQTTSSGSLEPDLSKWARISPHDSTVETPSGRFFATVPTDSPRGLSYALRFTTTIAPVDFVSTVYARGSGGTPCW